jgi:hypothetical protein
VYLRGALRKLLYHFTLYVGGLCYFVVVYRLWYWKIELVGCFDVRCFFEKRHQLREVKKLGKACPGAIARPLWGKLDGRCRLPKG